MHITRKAVLGVASVLGLSFALGAGCTIEKSDDDGDGGSGGSGGDSAGSGGAGEGGGGSGGEGGGGEGGGGAGSGGEGGAGEGGGGSGGEAGGGNGGDAGSGGEGGAGEGGGGSGGEGGGGSGGDGGGGAGGDGGGGSGGVGGTGGTGGVGGTGGTGGGSSQFQIEVVHRNTPTASQKKAFDDAAARWSELITGDIPNLADVPAGECLDPVISDTRNIDDLMIYALLEPIDGPGKVLGAAGPCFTRSGGTHPDLTAVGVMRFDTDDLDELESSGDLGATILHEMGHVLGFGTLWETKDLLKEPSLNNPGADTYFDGVLALALFDAVGGDDYTGNKVPVENDTGTFGQGSLDSHWREGVFDNELMTPAINGNRPGNPLSVVTVSSLADLGYTVDSEKADLYELPAAPRPGARARRVLNEVLLRPRFGIAPDGTVRKLPK